VALSAAGLLLAALRKFGKGSSDPTAGVSEPERLLKIDSKHVNEGRRRHQGHVVRSTRFNTVYVSSSCYSFIVRKKNDGKNCSCCLVVDNVSRSRSNAASSAAISHRSCSFSCSETCAVMHHAGAHKQKHIRRRDIYDIASQRQHRQQHTTRQPMT
jgi:hypothetical protein